jgi:hypothetical protein
LAWLRFFEKRRGRFRNLSSDLLNSITANLGQPNHVLEKSSGVSEKQILIICTLCQPFLFYFDGIHVHSESLKKNLNVFLCRLSMFFCGLKKNSLIPLNKLPAISFSFFLHSFIFASDSAKTNFHHLNRPPAIF